MIASARNHAAQVVASLKGVISQIECISDLKEDAYSIKALISGIEFYSVNFSIPDNGIILGDNLRGLESAEVSLPYPNVTIEYVVNEHAKAHKDEARLGLGKVKDNARKRLVYAMQLDEDKDPDFFRAAAFTGAHAHVLESCSGKMIWVVGAYYSDAGYWTVTPVAGLLSSRWDANGKYNWSMFKLIERDYQAYVNEFGKLTTAVLSAHVGENIRVVLELCEALSCSNVRDTIVQKADPAINQRRIKKGKLPLYETRILTIDSTKPKNQSGKAGTGSHASPRMHLRRGHIRRLPDKNVWVNSCVVGSKDQGVIDKSYSVTRGDCRE